MSNLLRCRKCNQMNNLPEGFDATKAICGKCKYPLVVGRPRDASTEKHRALEGKKSESLARPQENVHRAERGKKVTLAEAWFRMFVIFAPIFLPYAVTGEVKYSFIYGGLWLAVCGPIFVLPDPNIDNWKENAKYMHGWFYIVSRAVYGLFMLSMVIAAATLLLFGRGRM